MRKKVLAITPIAHIEGLVEKLSSAFDLDIVPDPVFSDVESVLVNYHAVFTNPNKSKLPIRKNVIDTSKNLEVIATASTGLIHIDMDYANSKKLKVLSLTKEYETINRISSTAEHALALTLALSRNIFWSFEDVRKQEWNYEKFIGRQMNALTVGIVGYGRLGKMYSRYIDAMGSEVLVCDPAYTLDNCPYKLVSIKEMFEKSDIIALHVHATKENINLVNEDLLQLAKPAMMLVNTSRGEIVNEADLVDFLSKNKHAKVATDVLADELENKWASPLYQCAMESDQVIITPHIGGMCKEAQEIAYHRVADMLIEFLK